MLLVIVIIGGAYAAWRYTQDQYYVGTDGSNVAIFQGVNQSVAGVRLSHVYEHTSIPIAGAPTTDQASIRATITASSLAGARQILANIRSGYQACQTAYAAQRHNTALMNTYNSQLSAYKKRFGSTGTVKVKGKVHHPPQKPKLTPVNMPTNCPTPATSSGGSP